MNINEKKNGRSLYMEHIYIPKDNNKEIPKLIVLLFISILVPGVGIIYNTIYLFLSKRLDYKHEKLAYFNIALSLGILAFSIHPGPQPGGDVYRYYLEMNLPHVQVFQRFIRTEKNLMNITFYGMMHLIQRASLPKNLLSFVSIFVSYFCTLLTLVEIRQKNNFKYTNISAILIALFFYVYSPYTLFSNYRTFLGVSMLGLGIAKINNGKKVFGTTLMIIGTVTHNAGWVILGLFIISRYVSIPTRIYWVGLCVLLINEKVALSIIQFAAHQGFFPTYIEALAQSYVVGSKAFMTSASYGMIHFSRALIILITTMLVYIIVRKREKENTYLRFLNIYLFFVLCFINYRMVAERFALLGIVLFIPLYYNFLSKDYPKLYKWLFLFLMLLNFDVFNFMDYGIRVGVGFPLNLFEPSISLIRNYIIDF